MDLGMTGSAALVLGSTAGLGRASAEALAAEGANVVVAGRRAELVDELAGALPSAAGVVVDLTDPDASTTLVAGPWRRSVEVDIVVLNGGGPKPGTALELDRRRRPALPSTSLLMPGSPDDRRARCPDARAGLGRIVSVGSSAVQQPIPTLPRPTSAGPRSPRTSRPWPAGRR